MTIEVLDIRGSIKPKCKYFAKGELDIAVNGTGIKILNIPYTVRVDEHVFVKLCQPKGRSIHLEDECFKEVLEHISESVLKHHEKDLAKVEEPQEKQPS